MLSNFLHMCNFFYLGQNFHYCATFTLLCKIAYLWEYETTAFVKRHTDSTVGENSFGRVVIGAAIVAPNEFGSGACDLVCCMDTALTDAEVERIGEKLHKYYF